VGFVVAAADDDDFAPLTSGKGSILVSSVEGECVSNLLLLARKQPGRKLSLYSDYFAFDEITI